MPMYVRATAPAGLVAALALFAVICRARECTLRLDVRIAVGEAPGGEALTAECEDVTRLSDR